MAPFRERIPHPHDLVRAMFPPWRHLQHPLVQFEVRHQQRLPKVGWTLIVVLFLGLITLDLTLIGFHTTGEMENQPFTGQVLPMMASVAFGSLWLFISLAHWRLIIVLAARTARIIAERRRRGEWDLIAVTPIPRMRWLQAQMIALGWQIFPLVRQIIIANFLLLLISGGYLIYFYSTEYNDAFYESLHIPVLIYALAISLIGGVAALFPLVEVPIYTAVGLLASSRSQRLTMSMLYSFFGIFAVRVILTTVLFYSSLLIFLVVGTILSGMGLLEDFDLDFISELEANIVLLGILYSCIAIPVFALFFEWLPAYPMVIMAANLESDAFVWMLIGTMLTGGLVYYYLPLRLLRWLIIRTVIRLNRRE